MTSSRRRFVAAAAALPLAAATAGLRSFSETEARLLDLLCAQIIPTDTHAGAREAGVVNYVDLQVAGPLKRYARYYHHGLANLAAAEFGALDATGQLAFLRRMEAGEMRGPEWRIQSAAAFFNMVIDHTMQGFYGDPQHGGNKDQVSWKMLGIGDLARGHRHA